MKHKRRAIVIACLVRLHNWCIDHRIKSEFNEVNGMVLGPTGRWVPAPRFDRDGRPVEYLDTHTESQMDLHPDARRDALLGSLEANMLRRPYVSHMRRMQQNRAR